ncbi:ABC-F family ATP-binding cassette domain-containing protein [Flavobacterium adhaerens]|uniref:ABC-F family ATP-binding cassette domain-containing protein n=1 Tax=Flavobacterium adhaerens TaxID=3149043 RepID=UPI0032B4980A
MVVLQNISYTHLNKDLLFNEINLTVNKQNKIALIGNNGVGKSTLLKIIANELQPTGGVLTLGAEPYYIPQIFGQYNHLTISKALQIEEKLTALHEILKGNTNDENFTILNNDWTFEDRCQEALHFWQLTDIDLSKKMETLSGGEKIKIFLAGILIHQPELVLLDEPSNHLDSSGRQLLYDFIQSSKTTMIIVSHDQKLLNQLHATCELTPNKIKVYGGNFDFYIEQKQIEKNALNNNIQNKEKALRKAKEKEREIIERQQKLDSKGKNKQEKSGVSRIMMNTLRNNAENSTSKIKSVHAEKINGISHDLQELRSNLTPLDKMKFGFSSSNLHKGKILFTAIDVNFGYNSHNLWKENLNFQITSGERIALNGQNGSGKTTLINLILEKLKPQTGSVLAAESKGIYIDQDYSLLNNTLNVYEQIELFNVSELQEHEIKFRLNHFLFTNEYWDKSCNTLSGGERMRLMLCCLTLNKQSPDLIILDEPTNNLDIQNVVILTTAINQYQGTLIVVSHDKSFLEKINIERTIEL